MNARLEEFRIIINSQDPDVIFLSETLWNNNFTVKFKNYSFVERIIKDSKAAIRNKVHFYNENVK